jgi:peptidylprolyl isomerase/peptidyl-prolyl cis-trans isomerase B (cyclophilin B)
VGTVKRERQKINRQQRLEELQRQQRRQRTKRRVLTWGALIILGGAALYVISLLVSRGDDEPTTSSTTVPAPAEFTFGNGPCANADGSSPVTKTFTEAPKLCIDPAKSYTATFDTSQGEVVVALDTTRTPGTVNNFVNLARFHYYDGSKIFRTDPSIDIIQGGGQTNSDSPGYTIPDEGGVFDFSRTDGPQGPFTYAEGDLVMARTAQPNSAGGQFFFGAGPNVANLDAQGTYVTFGNVTEGLDVVKGILALHQADDSGLGGKPSKDVTVNTITITES